MCILTSLVNSLNLKTKIRTLGGTRVPKNKRETRRDTGIEGKEGQNV
jgi:hypothetical protein